MQFMFYLTTFAYMVAGCVLVTAVVLLLATDFLAWLLGPSPTPQQWGVGATHTKAKY